MAIPSEFLRALERLAAVFSQYQAEKGISPVLVGGAAVTIFTDGQFLSGDFDIISADNVAFDRAMVAQGFTREDGPGLLRKGYYHPEHLGYSFEQVSGRLFDGLADYSRLRGFEVVGDERVALPATEDLIADRLAQHAVAGGTDDSRLRQAQAMLDLAPLIDMEYLTRRVEEEGGDLSLLSTPQRRLTP